MTTTITVYKRNDAEIDFQIYDANGTAQSLSNWTLTFSVNDTREDNSPTIQKTTSSGISHITTTTGLFTVTIDAADTSSLTAATFLFDIMRTVSSKDLTIMEGQFILKSPVYKK